MKMIFLILSALVLASGYAVVGNAVDTAGGKQRVLRHVVAFKFKETATPEQIKEVENAFRGLKKKIPQIAGYEWGINNSPENLNKGFTHGFILTFKTEKDRETYLPHPDHKAFGKMLGPLLADVFVIDFWAQE